MAKRKLVSISIINWNGIKETEKCLRSIKKFTTYPHYEVIVIDNGSTDESVKKLELLKQQGLIHNLVLNSKNLGNTTGYNQGLHIGKGEFVLLLDNDTEIIEKGWLKKMIEVAEGIAGLGMLGCKLIPKPTHDAWQPNTREPVEVECVCGAAMLIPKKIVQKVGWFDEKFNPGYYEEVDYCARIRKKGLKVVYSPFPTIKHAGSISFKKMPDKTYFLGKRNRLRHQLLNFPLWKLLLVLPYDFMVSVGAGILHRRLGLVCKAYWENLKNLGNIIKLRKKR